MCARKFNNYFEVQPVGFIAIKASAVIELFRFAFSWSLIVEESSADKIFIGIRYKNDGLIYIQLI